MRTEVIEDPKRGKIIFTYNKYDFCVNRTIYDHGGVRVGEIHSERGEDGRIARNHVFDGNGALLSRIEFEHGPDEAGGTCTYDPEGNLMARSVVFRDENGRRVHI